MHFLFWTLLNLRSATAAERTLPARCESNLERVVNVAAEFPELDGHFLSQFAWSRVNDHGTWVVKGVPRELPTDGDLAVSFFRYDNGQINMELTFNVGQGEQVTQFHRMSLSRQYGQLGFSVGLVGRSRGDVCINFLPDSGSDYRAGVRLTNLILRELRAGRSIGSALTGVPFAG